MIFGRALEQASIDPLESVLGPMSSQLLVELECDADVDQVLSVWRVAHPVLHPVKVCQGHADALGFPGSGLAVQSALDLEPQRVLYDPIVDLEENHGQALIREIWGGRNKLLNGMTRFGIKIKSVIIK